MSSRRPERRNTEVSPSAGPLRIAIVGAPDFSPHYERLLSKAGVESTPEALSYLSSRLQLAWMYMLPPRPRRRSPRQYEDFKQLKRSIKKTQTLIRVLRKYPHTKDIGFDLCPVGDGTIDVTTNHELMLGGVVDIPRDRPPLTGFEDTCAANGSIAAVNVDQMLTRLLRQIDRMKKQSGGQGKPEKRQAVKEAASFFSKYSTVPMTTYSEGPFAKFCEFFYAVITGAAVEEGNLAAQIRSVVRDFARSE
jgi:hypothetical protein